MLRYLRRSPATVLRPQEQFGYVPGRDLRLPYTVELDPLDYPLGRTMVSATLVIMEDFGLHPIVTKQITAVLSAAGQITDAGATGTGALVFELSAGDLVPLRSFTSVAFEVTVVDSVGYVASLDTGSLYTLPSTAGKPVDHILVTPSAFSVLAPATQHLTATAYDEDGNVVTDAVIAWSSSDQTVATVSATGLVTGVDLGAAIITASSQGKTATSTATVTVPTAIAATLDWNPLNPAERGDPLAFVSSGPTRVADGGSVGDGGTANTLMNASAMQATGRQKIRLAYPRSGSRWEQQQIVVNGMEVDNPPARDHATVATEAGLGPFDNTTNFHVTFDGVSSIVRHRNWVPITGSNSNDAQDASTYRIKASVFARLRAGQAAGNGQVRVALMQHEEMWPNPTIIGTPQEVVLTNAWQAFTVEFPSPSDSWDQAFPVYLAVIAKTGGPLQIDTAWPHQIDHQGNGAKEEWLHPLPYHDTLGALSQNGGRSTWYSGTGNANGNGNPALLGSATQSLSTVDAPDTDQQTTGTKYRLYTLPGNGDGIVSNSPVTVEQITDFVVSNTPTRRIYFGWLIRNSGAGFPADGALKVYAQAVGGPTYGGAPMVRETARPLSIYDGSGVQIACLYRGRLDVNTALGGTITGVVDNGDGTMTFATSAAHGLTASQHVDLDWVASAGNEQPQTDKVATVVDATHFKLSVAVDTGGAGSVHPRYLSFNNVSIQNQSGGQLQFHGYMPWFNPENDRMWGLHQMMIGRRTDGATSGFVWNEQANLYTKRIDRLITRPEGILLLSFVTDYALGQIARPYLNMRGGPGLLQSGPYGSADYQIDAGFSPDSVTGRLMFTAQVARGSPAVGSYRGWTWKILFPDDPNLFPRFIPVWIALAWKAGVPRLWIGQGTGTDLIEITQGASFLGSDPATVTVDTTSTDWGFSDPVTAGDPEGAHMGWLADRDRTRFVNGWLRYVLTSQTVPNLATIGDSIAYTMAKRCGARVDLAA